VPEEWEAAVAAAVLARQCATLDERGTRLDVVIGEAALHQQAGNTAVLSGQLCHLAALAGHHRRVTIRLLPFASRLSPAGGMGGFSVLRFGPAVDLGIVYVAGPDGGLFPADPHAAVGYLRAFDHLGHSRSARKPLPAGSLSLPETTKPRAAGTAELQRRCERSLPPGRAATARGLADRTGSRPLDE
jgi:hypothetical protein